MPGAPEEHAVIVMSGGGSPELWPTRGRAIAELEAFCATCGASVIAIYPNLAEAAKAAEAMVAAEYSARALDLTGLGRSFVMAHSASFRWSSGGPYEAQAKTQRQEVGPAVRSIPAVEATLGFLWNTR